MATATKIHSEYRLKLELSQQEAETLLFVMRQIGGSPRNSPRGITDKINEALCDAGVTIISLPTASHKDSILFEDYK